MHNLLGGTKEFLQIKHASHNDLVQKGGSLYEESIINFINNLFKNARFEHFKEKVVLIYSVVFYFMLGLNK